MQKGSNIDFAFFGKSSIKFFALYIDSPAGSVVRSRQSAQGKYLCWGRAQPLPDDTLHRREAMWGRRHGLSPTSARCQPGRRRHAPRLRWLEIRPPVTPHKTAVAPQGDLRAERSKAMLRWDEFHWGWTWQQEKAAPVTAYSHSSFHWGQDGQQTVVPLQETSPALALGFVLVLNHWRFYFFFSVKQ